VTAAVPGPATQPGAGQAVPAGQVPDQVRGAGAGIPAAVTNSSQAQDPRRTGTVRAAVRNRDLATPVTGTPDPACAYAPRPGQPARSRPA
jgi:hypothetical protein